ncbi:MAG: hypothetical protein IPP43_10380 [Chitinophagaceae bacterium]|nr:hypothetical protein [Chitinophagaceae bacterium]MBL0273869.1 hypothetical protein [Chitinophagaceae bacterium]
MKSIFSKTMMLLCLSTMVFSYTTKPGGEGFEIYLNNKVVIQQYGNEMNTVKSLPLNLQASNDELTIKYHHCGNIGKNRVITIKDQQNNVLKEFRYVDATSGVSAMLVRVKDLTVLKKGNSSLLKLYYSSSELPKGRMLASLMTNTGNTINP